MLYIYLSASPLAVRPRLLPPFETLKSEGGVVFGCRTFSTVLWYELFLLAQASQIFELNILKKNFNAGRLKRAGCKRLLSLLKI